MMKMNNPTILVVDDDKEIADGIGIFLKNEGYGVIFSYDGLDAVEKTMENEISLIILDIMMPKLDGIKALLKIREKKNIPVILLSAKSEDNDKIFGLTAGADDYVTKPFNPSELVARVKSQLRRYLKLGGSANTDSKIEIGGLCADKELKSVTVDGEEAKLTPMEYKILVFLMENKGKVYSADDIYRNVWNEDVIVGDNTIAVHIRHIREKIEINPKEPKYLKVVWGVGYKVQDIKSE